jgi:predicted amidohydrolase
MHGVLELAVAQPATRPGDVAFNAASHADAIRAAGARLIVFPELSLTGYGHHLRADEVPDRAWAVLVEACADARCTALVGAPARATVRGTSIATVAVDDSGTRIAYRKMWLGASEATSYEPGDAVSAVVVDGWRVGLGICRDTGVGRHVRDVADLGIDVYVAGLVHAPDELAEQDARGRAIAEATGVHVAFASFAGPTGGGYPATAGTSTVWSPSGEVLARAGDSPGEVAGVAIRLPPSGGRPAA